jgi:hypothetical protein
VRIILAVCICLIRLVMIAQEPGPAIEEHLLENETETSEAEPEDDFLIQQLEHFRRSPMDLNMISEEMMATILLLTPLQVKNFFSYKKLFGPLVNIYELQAIPGLDIETIRRLLPFVSIKASNYYHPFSSRFRAGEHMILFRVSSLIEKASGYSRDSSGYSGSPLKLLFRYKYQFRNLLQYGISAEKDAGETLFVPGQKTGFDFYTFHFFARDLGLVKILALGDYHINLGQGLVHWQGLAFKKSAETMNIKRQSSPVRAYNSTDENRFHRGLAITVGKRNIDFTFFAAIDQLDVNKERDSISGEEYVTSFQNSGYHRTKSERADKNALTQLVAGGSMTWSRNQFRVGINAVNYWFNLPIKKANEIYNLYSLSGRSWNNYSVDYSYTYRNLHFFGEAAVDKNNTIACVNAAMASIHPKVDLAVLYRNIPAEFRSLSANAFTDSREPTNEKGFYAGLVVRPFRGWTIQAYADHYIVPWLRFRVDSKGTGEGYLIQVSWKPDRNLEFSSRYSTDLKSGNSVADTLALRVVKKINTGSFRTQIIYKASRQLTIRNRVDFVWFHEADQVTEKGFSALTEVHLKCRSLPLWLNARLQFFETGGYNSRIYAYESDVMYSNSIPAIFDKGTRYYINIRYDILYNLQVWGRIAQTIYRDKQVIGSGMDKISGNRKTELRMQILLNF